MLVKKLYIRWCEKDKPIDIKKNEKSLWTSGNTSKQYGNAGVQELRTMQIMKYWGVREWSKRMVSKTISPKGVPWVRILPPLQKNMQSFLKFKNKLYIRISWNAKDRASLNFKSNEKKL